jgi:ferredoxin-type protein NapF
MTGGGIDLGRRDFLRGRLASKVGPVRPPWSSEATIAAACNGCAACVTACPQSIIRLDVDERPLIDFSAKECSFCGRCAEACGEPVFDRDRLAFQHVAAIGDACFAARGVVCQSCGDICPETAISFWLRIGGPALPALSADRCTGCGACIGICPADAISTFEEVEVNHA